VKAKLNLKKTGPYLKSYKIAEDSSENPKSYFANLDEEDRRLFDEEFIHKSIGNQMTRMVYITSSYYIMQVKRYEMIY